MATIKRDNSQVTTFAAASNADGITPVNIQVDPTSHGLIIDDNSTGSDFPKTDALRDQNSIPVMMGVSSADGITPVSIYADPALGKLLIQST